MYSSTERFTVFVVCPPRLESLLEKELLALGIKKYHQEVGGFSLSCDLTMIMRLNLWLRTASRILVRLSRFRVLHLDQLERPLSKISWERFFLPGAVIPIHVTATHSRLHHTEAIAQRAAEALAKLGFRPETEADGDHKAALLYLRVVDDVVEVSINSSGDHLYRRGYKQEVGPAPLRENLAAALLLHQGYKGQRSLWDPCCGCGTIPIEAAMIAAKIAPGRNRTFACLNWPICPKELWQKEVDRADSQKKVPTFPIFASDVSAKAIQMVEHNAKRAGVADFIQTKVSPLEEFEAAPIGKGGLMIANPPYGERIQGVKGLRTIYLSFGELLRKTEGLQGSLLVDMPDLAKLASRGAVSSGLTINHGGLLVTLYNL